MSEKIPQFNSPSATENKTGSRKSNRIKAAGQAVLAAGVLLAGEACSPDKRSDVEQAGGRDKQIEVQKSYMSPNPALLAEYRKNIHTGNFPAEGQNERTTARALEIIILKGMSVNKGSRIETKAYRTVPVEIKVDGQFIPVGLDDYTAEELRLARLAVGTSESGGSVVDKTSGQEDDEKISPMVKKIFKENGEKSNSENGKKIYISPDFNDFLDNGK